MIGTLITSAIALIIGVPVAVATALYLTELCPRRFRAPLAMLVDLLAAVPSVVYGLWGVFVLGPKLVPAERWFANTFSFIPFIGGGGSSITAPNYFVAGLILAIMILPIVSAIAREVLATVPCGEQGGGAGPRGDAVGDDPHRRAALRAPGHHRRRDAGAGPRHRRDDRGGAGDRQRGDDRASPLQPGLQPGRGDRQRVQRGGQPAIAQLRTVRRRARAVRADAARQHPRPLVRAPRDPRVRAPETDAGDVGGRSRSGRGGAA